MTPAPRGLRRLCTGIMAIAVAEFLIATTGVQIHRLPHSTDFATYYLAGAQARDGMSPYDRPALAARGRALGFDYDQFPFLYPPPFALAMQPLAGLAYPRARAVWMLVATAALLAGLAATTRLLWRTAAELGIQDGRYVWVLLAAWFPAALNSTSVHNDVRAGSVGCLLFMTLAFACLELRGRRGVVAGAALAVATLAKLTPFALVPWAAWRGKRRAAAIAVALLAASFVPAVLHWGPGIVADWWHQALAPSLHDDVAPPMNQSLDAFLSRIFAPSAVVESPFDAPRVGRMLSLAAGLAVAGLTLRRLVRRRRSDALLGVEMGFALLAVLALMKLTWVQTLAAMLWVWPVLMLAVFRAAELERPWAKRAGVLACLGFLLSSAHVPILWPALRHGPLVLVTGVHLAGVLLLWWTCGFVLDHDAELPATFEPAGDTHSAG